MLLIVCGKWLCVESHSMSEIFSIDERGGIVKKRRHEMKGKKRKELYIGIRIRMTKKCDLQLYPDFLYCFIA